MSAPQFSPGPLGLVTSDTPSANNSFHLYLVDTDRRKIAALWGSNERKLANGRLYSAAPELYEALAELVETLRREAPGTSLNNHRFDALGIKANNALAKARGERD